MEVSYTLHMHDIYNKRPLDLPALIKVDEIRTKLEKKIRYRNYSKLVQFFWEKAQCVCTLVKTATKKALFSRHTTAR